MQATEVKELTDNLYDDTDEVYEIIEYHPLTPYEDFTGPVLRSRIMSEIKTALNRWIPNYETISYRAKNFARLYRKYCKVEPDCDVTLQVLIWECFLSDIHRAAKEPDGHDRVFRVIRIYESLLDNAISAFESNGTTRLNIQIQDSDFHFKLDALRVIQEFNNTFGM
ncbi:MAG: hypothetical protein QXT99_10180 [Candidatus Nitrosotenuis sp.]